MKKAILINIALLLFSLNLTPNTNILYGVDRNNNLFNETKKQIDFENEVNLILKTIRIIETADNYYLHGKSKEYGAYQFTKSTWKKYSVDFFGKELDIEIPQNQDMVAGAKVIHLLNSGFEIDEIASYWNSGKKTYKNKIGINKYGVKYNVPQYVSRFLNTYNELREKEKKNNSILFCNLYSNFTYKQIKDNE